MDGRKHHRGVLLAKFLLTSNIYYVSFFILLEHRGFDSATVLRAVGFGSLCMLLGDFVTSFLTDAIGPKRPVFWGAVFQGISTLYLAQTQTVTQLYIYEFIMGISFPSIYGADSKWLRVIDQELFNLEKKNVGVMWLSFLASNVVGCLFLKAPVVSCYVSTAVYFAGALVVLSLPDIQTPGLGFFKSLSYVTKERLVTVIIYALCFGVLSCFPWMTQAFIAKYMQARPEMFAIAQVGQASLLFLGTWTAHVKVPVAVTVVGVALIVSAYLIFKAPLIVGLILCMSLYARGATALAARFHVLKGLQAKDPVATVLFIFQAGSKIVQAIALHLFSLRRL
jgi:hypothetical protein